MSTDSGRKLRKYIKVTITLFILLAAVFYLIGLRSIESLRSINTVWEVSKMTINGEDVTSNYEVLRFNLLDDGRVLLPVQQIEYQPQIKYARYRYFRRGYVNGVLEVSNSVDQIFNGKYEIDLLRHSDPKLYKVRSEKVELILEEKKFTLERPFINHDTPFNTK